MTTKKLDKPFLVGKLYRIVGGWIESGENTLEKDIGYATKLRPIFLVLDYREENKGSPAKTCRVFKAIFKEGICQVCICKDQNTYKELI